MDLKGFFNNINKETIDNFVKTNQEEHLTLEFKTVKNADFSDRNDRKNFAKSLSGFANSGGGIIVWGIDARPNQQGIDSACGTKDIEPLSMFVSKLNEFTGQFVNPFVDGIVHRKISTSDDKGFAATLVPESDAGPHMAKAGEDRYYKRSGGSFYRMEHFDIEDMFGRRKKPNLSLFTVLHDARVSSNGPQGKIYETHVVVGLKNTGRGIAKYIYFALTVNPPYQIYAWGVDRTGEIGLHSLWGPTAHFARYFGDANFVIHPNSNIDITAIVRKFGEHSINIEDLIIDAEIRAEGMMVVHDKRVFSGNDIIRKIASDAKI
jgi:hypothetical protein